MANEFAKALKGALAPEKALTPSLRILEEFCQGIEEATGGKVLANLKEGFVTNLGQEWRVVARPGKNGAEFILLRAHVESAGFPVRLDFYDHDLVTCINEAKLREKLGEFLRMKTTVENLNLLLQHATRSSTRGRPPGQPRAGTKVTVRRTGNGGRPR